jgi:hypothetical protein
MHLQNFLSSSALDRSANLQEIIIGHWQHKCGSGGFVSRYSDFKTFLYFEPSFSIHDFSTLYGHPLCFLAMSCS